jgi:hypothetical protein
MSRKIDVSKAGEWSREELEDNVRYLHDRGDTRALKQLKSALSSKEGSSTKSGGDKEGQSTQKTTKKKGAS